MKKIFIFLLAAVCAFALAACGGGSTKTQEIEFQGIKMNIPADWKAEKSTLSDDYAVYEKSGNKLLLTDTFGLMDDGTYDLEAAGKFFKEVTEDDASFSNPSDPVAGKLAGKYDMHTINCDYNVLNVIRGEVSYPCKRIRIYMGDHDVEIMFSSKDGDFEAFDKAIAEAVCK
jgi:hypothetical protein